MGTGHTQPSQHETYILEALARASPNSLFQKLKRAISIFDLDLRPFRFPVAKQGRKKMEMPVFRN